MKNLPTKKKYRKQFRAETKGDSNMHEHELEYDEDEQYVLAQKILVNNKLYCVMFAIQLAAAVLSVIAIMALLIPLVIQMKNGTFNQSTRSRSGSSRSARGAPYSTYNLYLVYLAFIDLAFTVSLLVAEGREMARTSSGERLDTRRIAEFVAVSYAMANCWINVFILYEVLLLLRASKNAQRISQPSLKRVNLQVGAVLLVSLPCGIYRYLSMYVLRSKTNNLAAEIIFWFVVFAALLYCVAVSILVKCKGYLPPLNGATTRDKAVRGLALYFFRVILVFLMIWIPSAVLYYLANYVAGDYVIYERIVIICHWLLAFQPILTFCMILTKPDVKKYIMDFVTLTYIFGNSSCCSRKKTPGVRKTLTDVLGGFNSFSRKKNEKARPDDSAILPPNATNVVMRRRTSTTVLGFTFSDVDENDSAIRSNSDGEQEEVAKSNAIGDCVDDITSNNITSKHDDDDDNSDGDSHGNVDMETGVSSI